MAIWFVSIIDSRNNNKLSVVASAIETGRRTPLPNSLVRRLYDGPLDVVGDVHGEIDSLFSLMHRLGYQDNGDHPEGRRLVFVGDLTDRGPNSPAVVDLVASLIDSGQAQCVLGNHELNILLNHRKHENKWFFGEDFLDENGQVVPQVLADDPIRRRLCEFFRSLPLALERPDLRVVHACWNNEMIDSARGSDDVVELYNKYYSQIDDRIRDSNLDRVDRGLHHQNDNPVKLLTSGPEERSDTVTTSGGKIRHERRVEWWNEYHNVFCLFGHYSILQGVPRTNQSAFCVDFGVGRRWTERESGRITNFSFKLASVRIPERLVVFDDGSEQPCGC
jgi:hypothetical protein